MKDEKIGEYDTPINKARPVKKLQPIPVRSATPGISGTTNKDAMTGCPMEEGELRRMQVAYCLVCGFMAGFVVTSLVFMVLCK
jgi:hypothetical protein